MEFGLVCAGCCLVVLICLDGWFRFVTLLNEVGCWLLLLICILLRCVFLVILLCVLIVQFRGFVVCIELWFGALGWLLLLDYWLVFAFLMCVV